MEEPLLRVPKVWLTGLCSQRAYFSRKGVQVEAAMGILKDISRYLLRGTENNTGIVKLRCRCEQFELAPPTPLRG